jgi:PAS domain S-box-containing protein
MKKSSRFTIEDALRREPPASRATTPVVWDACFDALLVVDEEGSCRRLNAAAAELLGAPADDLVGARLDQFTPCALRPRLERLGRHLTCRGDLHGTFELMRADGTGRLVEFRARRDVAPGEHLIVAREVAGYPTVSHPPAEDRRDDVRLTPREREILQLAADGGSTKTIANALVVSNGTVKTHFEHMYEKLGVGDRAAAVAEGFRLGLIE